MTIVWIFLAVISFIMYVFAGYWWYRDKTFKDFKNLFYMAVSLFICLDLAGGGAL